MALIKIPKNGKLVPYSTLRVTLKTVGRHFDAKLLCYGHRITQHLTDFERTNLMRSSERMSSSFLALIKILKNGKLVAYSTLRVTLKTVGRQFDATLHYVIDTVSLSV